MFYSANNVIHISRGETPTYRVRILDTDGAPYRLYRDGDNGMKDVVVSFTVRESLWETGENFKIKYNLLFGLENPSSAITNFNEIYMFKNTEVASYNDLYTTKGGSGTVHWDGSIYPGTSASDEPKQLYRMFLNNEYTYRYYLPPSGSETTGSWVEYEFVVQFPFRIEDTQDLMNKKYKYDLVLLSGELDVAKFIAGDADVFESIDFKKQLLSPSDFVVEASINE